MKNKIEVNQKNHDEHLAKNIKTFEEGLAILKDELADFFQKKTR